MLTLSDGESKLCEGEAALMLGDRLIEGDRLILSDGEKALMLGDKLIEGDRLILSDGEKALIEGDKLSDGEKALMLGDKLNDGLGLIDWLSDGIVLTVDPRRIIPIIPFCCILTIWPVLVRSSSTDIVLPPWIIY